MNQAGRQGTVAEAAEATAAARAPLCLWPGVPIRHDHHGESIHTSRAYAYDARLAAASCAISTAATATGDRTARDLMERHLLETSLVLHPIQPEGVECPGCKAIGLPNHIPCAPRAEALRLHALVERQQASQHPPMTDQTGQYSA